MKILLKSFLALNIVILLTQCQTSDGVEPDDALSTNNTYHQDKQLTLDEFIKSVSTDDERLFFEKHGIVDNRKTLTEKLHSRLRQDASMSKPKIQFKWGKGGCSQAVGICAIFTIGSIEANAEAITIGDQYIIVPDTEDNGLTLDGYLPISDDLYVDENTTIKAGIYAANYDESQNKFTAIVLDTK